MSDNNNLPYNIHYKVKSTWVYIKSFTRTDIPKSWRKNWVIVEVFNKEALGYFEDSRYEDCRINAYPPFIEYHGINRASKFSDGWLRRKTLVD
jgi:hypothetical protein